jgi:hypothetical protein
MDPSTVVAGACLLGLLTFLVRSVAKSDKDVGAFVQLGELQRRAEVVEELHEQKKKVVVGEFHHPSAGRC